MNVLYLIMHKVDLKGDSVEKLSQHKFMHMLRHVVLKRINWYQADWLEMVPSKLVRA